MLLNDISRVFSGRSVLVTGSSGFKGSWLTLWLARLGAHVTGISLPPDQGPDNLYERAGVSNASRSVFVDIRSAEDVAAAVQQAAPEVVFHLAAQSLVRRSYRDPLYTFSTNVMGTGNVLEAARHTPSVKAVVCVTTDKVYDNREWCWPYRESDPLGGADPYSASKSAAELLARPYMTALRDDGGYLMATARGGNVVGGGDWSEDRIVPDIVRALRAGIPLTLRHPGATRPWQHVLELCFGYLCLAARLMNGWPERGRPPESYVGSYNFGPDSTHEMPVAALVARVLETWGRPDYPVEVGSSPLHESKYLRLDSSKARAELGWRPLLSFDETVAWTARWYQHYCDDPTRARALVEEQFNAFSERCGALR